MQPAQKAQTELKSQFLLVLFLFSILYTNPTYACFDLANMAGTGGVSSTGTEGKKAKKVKCVLNWSRYSGAALSGAQLSSCEVTENQLAMIIELAAEGLSVCAIAKKLPER